MEHKLNWKSLRTTQREQTLTRPETKNRRIECVLGDQGN